MDSSVKAVLCVGGDCLVWIVGFVLFLGLRLISKGGG